MTKKEIRKRINTTTLKNVIHSLKQLELIANIQVGNITEAAYEIIEETYHPNHGFAMLTIPNKEQMIGIRNACLLWKPYVAEGYEKLVVHSFRRFCIIQSSVLHSVHTNAYVGNIVSLKADPPKDMATIVHFNGSITRFPIHS